MTTPEAVAYRVARDDEQLMTEITAGSADALAALYDRYSGRAYRVARSVCRDPGRTEEAVQEAFISIWRSPATYRSQRGTVSAWLLAVVRCRAVDIARRHGIHSALRTDDDRLAPRAAPGGVADHAVTRADADRLPARLARLPEAQQEVITLAFYGELSYTEVAAQLDLPTGTIKVRMRLGLQTLRADSGQAVA